MPTIPLSGEIPRGAINNMEIGANQIIAQEKDFFAAELLSKMAGGPRRAHRCRFIRREQRAAMRES